MADSSNVGGFFLDKLKAIGGKIENVASTISSAVGTNDLDRIRSVHQLAKEHSIARRGERRFTEQELDSAEKRADAIIATLPLGYFEEGFDPVAAELDQLSNEAMQEEIDALVDKLTIGLEAVGSRLSRHVFKKREQLLQGIDNVASVEDDIKAAFMMTRTTRGSLKSASEEVMRNLRVAGQTRRKRGYMELMEVVLKIKRCKDLQFSLKKAQECGEYGEAILLCVQCFQGVESIQDLGVAGELRATVQRLYVETLQRLDNALTVICGQFDPERYSKVLEGYMLQGIDGKQLADKVQQCFKDSIHDATMRVVRSLLLTKPKLVDSLVSNSLEGSYGELCRALPVDLLRPCLLKLLEVLYDVLVSYHVMGQWHAECIKQQAQLGIAPQPDQDSSPPQQQQQQQPGDAEQAHNVQQSTINFLVAVNGVLAQSRGTVFEVAALRVMELLNMPGLFKGEDFLQVVEWSQKFLGVGEAFLGGEASELRSAVASTTSKFFDQFHRGNIETLMMMLHNEQWQTMTSNGGSVSIDLDDAIRNSPFYQPPYSDPAAIHDFGVWVVEGNPFVRSSLTSKKQKDAAGSLHQNPSEASLTSTPAARTDSSHSLPSQSEECAAHSMHHDAPAAAGLAMRCGSVLDPPGSHQAAAAGGRQGESSAPQGESSGRLSGPDGGTAGGRMLTVSSQHAMKLLRAYGQLLLPLNSRAADILHSMTEVFDTYLLRTFILFSGITLEHLVWKDNILPNRLRSALLRILTTDGSKFKQQVEELQRLKPLQASKPNPGGQAPTGISWLDKFGSTMESIATDLERSANKLSQKLGDRVQGMPVPAGLTSSGSDASSHGSSASLHGLQERIVAAESLMHMADELRAGRAALAAVLPAGTLQRELEAYFSPRGTLESTQDLKASLFRGGTRKLLQGMLDPDNGTAVRIAMTEYAVRDPSASESPWAYFTARCYSTFKELIAGATLPTYIKVQMWDYAIEAGAEAMLDGLSQIKRCTLEGRALMSFDLAYVEKQVKGLAPPGFTVSFRTVDQYIKAFYLPWDELARWVQVHFPEYGKYKVTALIEVIADAYKVKRATKLELLDKVERISVEFA